MEFAFASDKTNNAYLDRIIQTGVEISIEELSHCLQHCNIARRALIEPRIQFEQNTCLCNIVLKKDDCTRAMSLDLRD
jgi:hypothetical protein